MMPSLLNQSELLHRSSCTERRRAGTAAGSDLGTAASWHAPSESDSNGSFNDECDEDLQATLSRSIVEKGGPCPLPWPHKLEELHEGPMIVGDLICDPSIEPPEHAKDPCTLNWVVNPCALGPEPHLHSHAAAQCLQAEAREKGDDFFKSPATREQAQAPMINAEPRANHAAERLTRAGPARFQEREA